MEWRYYTLAEETILSKNTRQCLFNPEKSHQFINFKLLQDIVEQKGLIKISWEQELTMLRVDIKTSASKLDNENSVAPSFLVRQPEPLDNMIQI